jgi:MSHA biogenesis protein MshO
MADHVSACSFIYHPGTPQHSGMVTLGLTLTDAGETITLMHQVHVENAP